jgi:hypothetical protein
MALVVAAAVELTHATALKLTPENAAGFKDQLRSKVVFLEIPNRDALPAVEWEKAAAEYTRLRDTVESGKPSLLVLIDSRGLGVPQTQHQRSLGMGLKVHLLRSTRASQNIIFFKLAMAAIEFGPDSG